MNSTTKLLLDKVNSKLENSSYFYISRDSERSLGLENYLKNFNVICIEDSPVVDGLIDKSIPVFCSERENIEIPHKSTLNLLKQIETINWINNRKKDSLFVQFFQFSQPAKSIVEKLGGTVLNNSAELNRTFENKFSQFKIFKENNVVIPKSYIIEAVNLNYHDITAELGAKFIIQKDIAHTGSGTFFVESEEDLIKIMPLISGNDVKISKFIEGKTFTINGCIAGGKVFVSGLQYQITGITELADGKGTTVGNDWCYANQIVDTTKQKIVNEVKKIGNIMIKYGYKGLFGIDLALDNNDNIFIIEINARQTANITMQTRLELETDITPLALLHIAELMNIEIEEEPRNDLVNLNGSQVFLRAKTENMQIQNHIMSGVYRLQGDNSAVNWETDTKKENVIFLDEDMDKPIIFQNKGYCINDIANGGFVLTVQKEGQNKEKGEEIARIQLKQQIIFDGVLSPWVLELFSELENLLK